MLVNWGRQSSRHWPLNATKATPFTAATHIDTCGDAVYFVQIDGYIGYGKLAIRD